jgi:hypothetical protein
LQIDFYNEAYYAHIYLIYGIINNSKKNVCVSHFSLS